MPDLFSACICGLPLSCGLEGGQIVALRFGAGENSPRPSPASLALWERLRGEIGEYLAGGRRSFDLPVRLAGTPFQKQVWRALMRIPYGETRTYGEIAKIIGRPGAARAVGSACHRNPVVLLIPCHRVVGSGGDLTGFAGGIPVKARLLALEGSCGCAVQPKG